MAGKNKTYRSQNELMIRESVARWGRSKWPNARIVHELVVGRGDARADMAFVCPDRIVAVEIKTDRDYGSRLLNQAAMFRLACHELWLVGEGRHKQDFELIKYLMPSVGVCGAVRLDPKAPSYQIEECEQPDLTWTPHRDSMLSICWVEELKWEATRHRVWMTKGGTHAQLLKAMHKVSPQGQTESVCRQLRARDAFWRADPLIPLEGF